MSYLQNLGHDVSWLDPASHAAAIAAAEGDIKDSFSRPQSPVCGKPGHRGNERGGAFLHNYHC
eukprot:444007-Heterocapsa_arctica.AAC.1